MIRYWASFATLTALAQSAIAAPEGPKPTSPSPDAAPAQPTPAAKLPISAFAMLPFVENAKLSPKGDHIAGLFGINGEQMIIVMKVIPDGSQPVGIKIPDLTEIDTIQWVNEDNIVIRMRALLSIETDKAYVTRLLAFNRVTSKQTKLKWDLSGQHASTILWTAQDGSPEIIMAGQASIYDEHDFWPKVFRVNVETGKARQVLDGKEGVHYWGADANGNVRMGIRYDDSTQTSKLLYRDAGESGFKTVDKADGRKREDLNPPFMFVPGTSHGLFFEDNSKGKTAIVQNDLATGKTIKTLYSVADQSIKSITLSRDDTTLLGYEVSGKSGTVWLDSQIAKIQSGLDSTVKGAQVEILSFSQDRQKMLVRISGSDAPGGLFAFSAANNELRLIAHYNDELKMKRMAPNKLVQYTARDGLKIEGVLTLPKGRTAKSLPFIVLPHGGPWAHDELSYDYWAQFIANRGYAVLQPNFRGSTGYGQEFERKGEGQMGLAMQDDVTDGVKWAISQGIADPKRVCIVGASYGGYAAMWGVIKDPDVYRCSISISGVSDLKREVRSFENYSRANSYTDDWKRMTPDFAAVSPANAVDRIKVPMLLIHGKKDVTVNYKQSQLMYDRMKGAKKNVEMVLMPLADHYFTREEDRTLLLSAIEQFLAKHNPAN